MADKTTNDKKFQDQMNAWLMIQVIGRTSVNFINKKKLAKELSQHLDILAADELPEFAEYFIDSCLSSKSYTTAVFGTLSMSSAGAATRLAQDIDEVTGVIPERFELREKSSPIRAAFFEKYLGKIQNAQKLLNELGIVI
jgi:hypothetical protein